MTKRCRIALAVVTLAALAAFPAPTLAGDAFFKGGLTFHPDVGGFTDSWFLSIGSDWGFNETGFLGLELQGAYRSNNVLGVALVDAIPFNAFINGKWKMQPDRVRPFVGLGFGMMSSYVTTEVAGVKDSDFVKDGGFQFMGGVELSEKWVFELQAQRVFVEGAQFAWSFLAGARW